MATEADTTTSPETPPEDTATGGAPHEPRGGGITLGIERWVQFAFIGAALFTFWFLDHFIDAVWNVFAEPDPTIVTAASAVVAVVGAFVLYRSPNINVWAHEVAAELSKATWPTRKETRSATVVVLIVSLIAAVILGVFDAGWAAVTDLIYDA
jgi:preprotein translocase subunit SecE